MKKFLKTSILSIFLCLTVFPAWAAKPFPKDPVERAKALERYKQGLGLYAQGQKLQSTGKYDEANATYSQAMNLFQDGPKPDMANCFNRLGNVYLDKTPERSLWYYKEALRIRMQDHGEAHEAVAASHNNAGTACIKMKKYDQAIAHFESSMGIFQRATSAKDKRQVGATHNRLGSAYTAKNEHGEAKRHHEKALEIFLKVFGPNHPNIARAKRDLGYSMIQNKEKRQGLAILNEAKDIYIATKGAQYIETLELIQNIKKLR
jgi:tetratricopeptide (TPR) repeat protein